MRDNQFAPHMTDLQGMSVPAVLRFAFACSNKSDDEIAAEMGWNKSVANRVFSNGDYWPSLPTLPRFCQVVGNLIVPYWIIADANICAANITPMDAGEMLKDLRRLMRELADVLEEGEKALADNVIDAKEARRAIREIEDLFKVAAAMLGKLQAVIDTAKGA